MSNSSKVNGDVGARTQMASLVCSAIVLLATFFLLPWLYYLPKCVLASMSVIQSFSPLFALADHFPRICLIVFSLLAEAPHDIKFFWKYAPLMSSPPPKNPDHPSRY